MLTRRHLMTIGVVAGGAAIPVMGAIAARDHPAGDEPTRGPAGDPGGHGHSGGQAPDGGESIVAAAPFTVQMPVPAVLSPTSTDATTDYYTVTARAGTEQLQPGVNTPIIGYNGSYLGPTIKARKDRRVVVTHVNQLGEATAVHLHGGQVVTSSDGFPTDTIAPGGNRVYQYANTQRAATLWYHDHAHHLESEHIYRGLHGFYLINDPADDALQLPGGAFDIPIMLTDARFAANGTLVYQANDVLGRTSLLANGRVQPFFPVSRRKYRFRLLNASNLRHFTLQLGSFAQMRQIATDGGLMAAPFTTPVLLLSPAERVEVVIDFAQFPLGSQVYLRDVMAGPVLRFDVTSNATDNSQVPSTLRPLPGLGSPTVSRTFNLTSSGNTFLVNGKVFDPNRVDLQVRAGATEVWTITNNDAAGHVHNFHPHLVHFRVLSRNGRSPEPGEAGLKDTVLVQNRETVRIQLTFGTNLGRSVAHCHFVDHSSSGMMARMDIVP